ncbi:MAG: hypothetical protein ACI9N1_000855 [Flavobacteriales bacterium]|jgi:hypothetical protein
MKGLIAKISQTLGVQFITSILFILTLNSIYAQKDFLLYGLDNVAQSQYVNPAFGTNSKAYFSFPLLNQSVGLSHSGFQFNHLVHQRAEDDSLVLKPDIAISKMTSINYLTSDIQNELFSMGFSVKKTFFSLSVVNKLQTRFMYPKDLFTIAFEGNGKSLLGKRASFDGMGVDALSYLEIGVGFNREINDKLKIGGRLKYLNGMANIHTRKSDLGVFTDETTFDLTVDGSFEINSSNIEQFTGTNGVIQTSDFIGKNKGVGIDLGAVYKLTDKIELSASVVDLGVISWKSNVKSYETNNFEFRFEGVDMEQFLSDSSDVLQTFVDSLETSFTVSENEEAYRTGLYTRVYIGGKYSLTEKVSVGGVWYNEFINSRYRAAITASGDVQLTNWLRAAVNYTYYSRDYKNVGMGFVINGGPVQFYLMTDNVIGFVAPYATKNWHFRTGINFLIGRDKKIRDDAGSLE